jgi:hypothetical protein
MNESTIKANETTVPVLPCISVDETLEFYQALGFEITYKMTKPYLYLALSLSGFELHFGRPPVTGINPSDEDAGGCLVMVDAVAPYHAAFTEAIRRKYGKVLNTGRPRITRYRPGASRFSVIDPSGNTLIFIQRDEPKELEYGGSKGFEKLAKSLDNSRILREFKHDDRAAVIAINSGLRKFGAEAPAVDRARAYATLIELAIDMDEREKIESLSAELRAIPLTEAEQRQVASELREAENLDRWLKTVEAT